jgi:hypothetical protein
LKAVALAVAALFCTQAFAQSPSALGGLTEKAKGADVEKKAGDKADAKLTEGEKKVGVPGAADQAKAAASKETKKAKKAKAKGHEKAKGAADKVDAAAPKL